LRLSIIPIPPGLIGSGGLDEFIPRVAKLEELKGLDGLNGLDGLDGLKAVQ
jgi:hypothetical protein